MLDQNHAEIDSPEARSIQSAREIGARSGSDFPRIGVRGYLRMTRVTMEFFFFMLRVFLHTQRWLWRKTPQSELRRREGALLRGRLIKLGPTFIKTGQT